jgi:hypothetical protein
MYATYVSLSSVNCITYLCMIARSINLIDRFRGSTNRRSMFLSFEIYGTLLLYLFALDYLNNIVFYYYYCNASVFRLRYNT